MLEQYLRSLIEPLLAEPAALAVVQSQDQMGVLFTVSLHKADMGTVIGKEGETAKSIRCLMRIMGAKNKAHVAVKILEPADGKFAVARTLEQMKTIDEALKEIT